MKSYMDIVLDALHEQKNVEWKVNKNGVSIKIDGKTVIANWAYDEFADAMMKNCKEAVWAILVNQKNPS